MIVVILVGILAAIVYPIVQTNVNASSETAFVTSARAFAEALQMYFWKTGEYPESPSPGVEPPGMSNYVHMNDWDFKTPIGGAWTARRNIGGVQAAVGVEFSGDGPDGEVMNGIDSSYDDGNLATGKYRQIGGGYYLVVAR